MTIVRPLRLYPVNQSNKCYLNIYINYSRTIPLEKLVYTHTIILFFIIMYFTQLYKVPHILPPPTSLPTHSHFFWPWPSPVLGHIQFACPMGLWNFSIHFNIVLNLLPLTSVYIHYGSGDITITKILGAQWIYWEKLSYIVYQTVANRTMERSQEKMLES